MKMLIDIARYCYLVGHNRLLSISTKKLLVKNRRKKYSKNLFYLVCITIFTGGPHDE